MDALQLQTAFPKTYVMICANGDPLETEMLEVQTPQTPMSLCPVYITFLRKNGKIWNDHGLVNLTHIIKMHTVYYIHF